MKEKEYTPISSVVEWSEEYWREMEYDSSGNLTKETWYEPDGSMRYWREYEYITLTVISEEDSAGLQPVIENSLQELEP